MKMVFNSDKQRKAVMAKLKGTTRSDVNPTIVKGNPDGIKERLRKRFRPTAQELAEQRGTRLQKEAQQLSLQRQRTRQLELEARLETERESVRKREQTARATLADIDKARFQRTVAGRVVARGRELGRAGIKKLTAPAPRRKIRAKPKRVKPEKETGAFGIEF